MSIKNIKETALLVNLAKQFGQDVDTKDLEKVNNFVQIQSNIKQSVKASALKDLAEAFQGIKVEKKPVIEYPLPPSLEDLETLLETTNDLDQTPKQQDTTEHVESEKISEVEQPRSKSLAELAAESITTATQLEGFFDKPEPREVDPEFKAVAQ